jgi:hypothetical protein
MKKLILLLLAMMLFLGLAVSGAMAFTYTILNNTDIQDSNGNWGWNGRTNPIQGGPPNDFFNTYGADWAGGVLTIYSRWSPIKNNVFAGIVTADLIIDKNSDGIWDFSVGLDPGNNNATTRINNYYIGNDIFTTPSGTYGVNVNQASPHRIVTAKPNQETQIFVPVVWAASTKDGTDMVSITLGNLVGDQFTFMWASGTCGNGPIEGKVPVPPSVLLLGSGLVGLCLLRRKWGVKA